MTNEKNYLTEGKISTALIKFAIPFLVASLLQALYGAVDLFVVGQFDTSASVSAVAVGSQVMQTITGIVLGLTTGGTVLIGRRIGEKDDNGAAKAVGSIGILFIVLAVILTPVMFFCTDFAVNAMNTPSEAIEYTKNYLYVCVCGIPFIVGYNAISGILRGMGNTKTPMYFIIAACIVNVALDFLFVGWFHMGAFGAAVATVAAQAVSFIFALIVILKRGFPFEFHKKDFKCNKNSLKFILKVGSPLALQDALVNVSFLIITAIINSMGLTASASVGVVEKIIVFAMLVPTAFASAVATTTSQNIGAGKPERAEKSLVYGILYSLVFGVAFCIYAWIFPQTLTGIFSTDSAVIKMAADYLKPYSFDCIFVSFIFCMNSYFSGCGKSVISFVHSIIATFGVRVPGSYILSLMEGTTLFTLGFVPPVASVVSVLICLGYFFFITKKRKQLQSDK